MTKGRTRGGQEGILIEEGSTTNYSINDSWGWVFIYVYSGIAHIELEGDSHVLEKGDLFVIKNPDVSSIQLGGKLHSEVVLCWIENNV